jgi:hypothetical protein
MVKTIGRATAKIGLLAAVGLARQHLRRVGEHLLAVAVDTHLVDMPELAATDRGPRLLDCRLTGHQIVSAGPVGGLTKAEEPERQLSSPAVTAPRVLDLRARLVVQKNGTGGGPLIQRRRPTALRSCRSHA